MPPLVLQLLVLVLPLLCRRAQLLLLSVLLLLPLAELSAAAALPQVLSQIHSAPALLRAVED
jgi:hypothetical protein